MRPLPATAVAVLLILAVGQPAWAMIAWVSLEDRLANSDVVAVGEIVKIDEKAAIEGAEGLVPCTIKLARVLKGPAIRGGMEAHLVRLLWRKPPEGGPLSEPPPPTYRVGDKRVWQLKKHPAAADVYTDAYYYFKEPVDRADLIVTVLAAMSDPVKALTDEQAEARVRLSAAYALLRNAVPAEKLPRKEIEVEEKGVKVRTMITDRSGHVALDAGLVQRAAEAAVGGFTAPDPYNYNTALAALDHIGCPAAKLRPQTDGRRYDHKEHLKAWAAAVKKWWDENGSGVKVYLPKAEAKKFGLAEEVAK